MTEKQLEEGNRLNNRIKELKQYQKTIAEISSKYDMTSDDDYKYFINKISEKIVDMHMLFLAIGRE